jgi:hypothetical protein
MKPYLTIKSLARVLAVLALLAVPGINQAQTYTLFGISGKQQADEVSPGVYTHADHTLYQISTTNALLTQKLRMSWVPDSDAIGYCPKTGLLYHTASGGAYRDNMSNVVRDQDPNTTTECGACQDNHIMESYNLLTGTLTGIYNANPCPNPDNPTNDIGGDGLFMPCFGLAAPIPPWVEPQYRRDSTQTGPGTSTNRITGPNEVGGIRGFAWSAEHDSWFVSNGELFKMSLDGMTNVYLSTPEFLIPTIDLDLYPTGYRTNADLKDLAFINVGGKSRLFGTWRGGTTVAGNTNGCIIEIDPATGISLGLTNQILLNYPPGGGDPVDEFGGLLGLTQNPQTGVVYGLRKTGDVYARELVTIDMATGNTTLVGILTDGTYGQAITTIDFVPDILVTSANQSGTTLNITWTGAASPTFSLQTASSAAGPWTTVSSGLSGPSTSTSITNSLGLFRISKP